MFIRNLQISHNYSSFLFGARSTGKTTLLQQEFKPENTFVLDLLDVELEDMLGRKPGVLTEILDGLDSNISYVVIDEIQKLPRLLEIVHQYIQKNEKRFYFILTGSSAKKLKAGGADLLAGRAFVYNLYPLTFIELGNSFDLEQYLQYGGLPAIYQFDNPADKEKYLKAYGLMYLKEEIWNEHIVRKLDPFRMFLEIAAFSNGEIINYRKIANQIKVDAKTVNGYFNILVDTLIGFEINAYHTSIRKQLISSPKFYLIDPGIKRALENTLKVPLTQRTSAYGHSFEHFIISQIYFLNNYYELDLKLYYLKTKDGAEIDLILERPNKSLICIEIKSTTDSTLVNTQNLSSLANDLNCKEQFCFSQDPISRKEKDVLFVPWQKGIKTILGK